MIKENRPGARPPYRTVVCLFKMKLLYLYMLCCLESGAMGSVLLGIVTHRDVDFLDTASLSMRVTEVCSVFPKQIALEMKIILESVTIVW